MECLITQRQKYRLFLNGLFGTMVVNKQLKPSLNILELLSERTISETESLSYAKWTFGTMVVNKQLKPN